MAFIDPRELATAEPKPGWHGRFFHSDHMTFAYYVIDGGAGLGAHAHPNEEVWHIIEGEANITLDGRTQCVRAGEAAIVPAGTTHSIDVPTGCRAIVVDHPVRREIGGVKI